MTYFSGNFAKQCELEAHLSRFLRTGGVIFARFCELNANKCDQNFTRYKLWLFKKSVLKRTYGRIPGGQNRGFLCLQISSPKIGVFFCNFL